MSSKLTEDQINYLKLHSALFYYDETSPSGLRNRITRGKRAMAGVVSGSRDRKHWRVNLKGRTVGAHQLVWLLNGRELLPGHELDHINRNGFDNRISNLRLVSPSFNRLNRRVLGSIPFRGVCFHKASGKFTAQKGVNGVKHYLGCFDSAEEAASAWDAFCIEHVQDLCLLCTFVTVWLEPYLVF